MRRIILSLLFAAVPIAATYGLVRFSLVHTDAALAAIMAYDKAAWEVRTTPRREARRAMDVKLDEYELYLKADSARVLLAYNELQRLDQLNYMLVRFEDAQEERRRAEVQTQDMAAFFTALGSGNFGNVLRYPHESMDRLDEARSQRGYSWDDYHADRAELAAARKRLWETPLGGSVPDALRTWRPSNAYTGS